MKITILIISLLISVTSYAQEKSAKTEESKIYTQSEFDKKLIVELEKNLKRLGKTEIIQLSKELLEKERALDLKEIELNKVQQSIDLSTLDLQKKIATFDSRQKKLLACMDNVKSEDRKRIMHMVQTISKMRPQSAADVLAVQDPAISVKILGYLEPEKVSKIFNKMDKEISARLQKQYLTMKK